jgi:hypothetical protein
MIVAILVVIHIAIARGVDRSVPIILNEIDLTLTGITAAAIRFPVLALIGRNPQVHSLIIFRTQKPNQDGARVVELRIGKALDI